MEKNSKIYVAGHSGFVGSAIMRALKKRNYTNLLIIDSLELNLRDAKPTEDFFMDKKPEYVFLAAATAGGIKGIIDNPVEFLRNNIEIETNILDSSYKSKVKKVIFLGSSCAYSIDTKQPYKERDIAIGKYEPNIEPFALAKAYGIKLCQAYNREYNTNFIVAIPCTLYGPHDNFFDEGAHFVPNLIQRFHKAKIEKKPNVTVWGSGKQRRELLHVDDAAEAFIFLMENYNLNEPINIGAGSDISIKKFSNLLKKIVDYKGELIFDKSKPEGILKKLIDSGKINTLGWRPNIKLEEGLKETYSWFVKNFDSQ